MEKSSKIVVIGAGAFGLSVACQLSSEGYENITVLDRHTPPVPDGSSTDISRVVRFDYADEDYLNIAHEAYKEWRDNPKYKDIFFPSSYILCSSGKSESDGWVDKTTAQLTKRSLPWTRLDDAEMARQKFPILSGTLATPGFIGYYNEHAGWADAGKAISQLRDECLETGVSLICGQSGIVIGFNTDANGTITSVRTADQGLLQGDHFILTAGAWASSLVPMHNTVLSTAQVVGYTQLSQEEVLKYKDLPIYANFSTGWFNFPPHKENKMLKMAVHGWGYTREPKREESTTTQSFTSSTPPLAPREERPNFVPSDGENRLREGLREILPELADRPFEKVCLCWYTDTPTGDFIMDYHPDYKNLFIGGGGSGHAFKFLPVLGNYMSQAIQKRLPPNLASKWRFHTEYQHRTDVFLGDGSRGGPSRRELSVEEKAMLYGPDPNSSST